jgi:hypothetical protein
LVESSTHFGNSVNASLGHTALLTDSTVCPITRVPPQQHTQYVVQDNGMHVPVHLQITPITQPPPHIIEEAPHPHTQACGRISKVFLLITIQLQTRSFHSDSPAKQQTMSNFRLHQQETDRDERLHQIGVYLIMLMQY